MIAITLGCALCCCKNKHKRSTSAGTFKYCEVNFTNYSACTKNIANKNRSFSVLLVGPCYEICSCCV